MTAHDEFRRRQGLADADRTPRAGWSVAPLFVAAVACAVAGLLLAPSWLGGLLLGLFGVFALIGVLRRA